MTVVGGASGAGLSPRGRFQWLDVARGIALAAMALYHFIWDLALFGLVDPYTPFEFGWVALARLTATAFLLLVGVGLYLGHGRGIRWRPFWRRLSLIAGAAAVITVGTWIAMPDAFIFFGILHMIAVGSLAGLLLVRHAAWVSFAVATIVVLIATTVAHPIFDAPMFWWTGLGTRPIQSNDLVPFFPSFAAVATGIGIAKIARLSERSGDWWTREQHDPISRSLAFAGRHSLAVYLAHQPILIGLVWLYVRASSG